MAYRSFGYCEDNDATAAPIVSTARRELRSLKSSLGITAAQYVKKKACEEAAKDSSPHIHRFGLGFGVSVIHQIYQAAHISRLSRPMDFFSSSAAIAASVFSGPALAPQPSTPIDSEEGGGYNGNDCIVS
jgi:hypothetical protein